MQERFIAEGNNLMLNKMINNDSALNRRSGVLGGE